MTGTTGSSTRRDDSAWPNGALPLSLLIGSALLVAAAVLAGRADQPGVGLGCLAAGLAIGATMIVVGIRRWLRGEPFPASVVAVAVVVSIVGWVAAKVAGGAGAAFLLGLGAGCLLANVWAVRAARANRDRVG